MPPRVSAIILTQDRPALLQRAIHSVLTQTISDLELLVVMDAASEETHHTLAAIKDSRLRTTEVASSRGTGHARNIGAREARARWIAFLDDDDEWFPEKLEQQLETAEKSRFRYPVISCRVIARHDAGDLVWPRRAPRDGEAISEYLFCQNGIRTGEGLLLPSALMMLTEFTARVPFATDLSRHEDIDWQLRASTVEGFGVEFVPTPMPLAIWHVESNRARISLSTDWHHSLGWARANRMLFSPRAYASFMMTNISNTVARHRDWKGLLAFLWEAHRYARPGFFDWLACLSTWLVPMQRRRELTLWLLERGWFH